MPLPERLLEADRQPLWKRLGWMLLLWLASVAALSLVALLLRHWLQP